MSKCLICGLLIAFLVFSVTFPTLSLASTDEQFAANTQSLHQVSNSYKISTLSYQMPPAHPVFVVQPTGNAVTPTIGLGVLNHPSTTTLGITTRVSVASDGTEGNQNSGYSSVSANGRYVAFSSLASNLVSGDTNVYDDVFVHDRQTGQTERVSVASDGSGENGGSGGPAISADGRYVVFGSHASNLVSGDTNSHADVFVHDRQTGQTERVSVASDESEGNQDSGWPSVSADGRCVVFGSYASSLVPGDTNGHADVFVHDRQTGQTERVSVASDGAEGNSDSVFSSISADGRYVAFSSPASNFVPDDTNSAADVFVHDRQTGQTKRASVASDGSEGNQYSFPPSVSADGRYVAFVSLSSNLVPSDTNSTADAFVHDQQTGQTERVSVASDGVEAIRGSQDPPPSVSANGRYVAFVSLSSNLVPSDTNSFEDVFVHDRQTGQTARVSVASSGLQGNSGGSTSPSVSADGRYVAFESGSSNLVAGDTNLDWDVFVHDRCPDGSCGSGTLTNIVVNVTAPNSFGGFNSLITATTTLQNTPVLSATVRGSVELNTGVPLRFDLNDRGRDGDRVANDGIYSGILAVPGLDVMPPGNYYLSVAATKDEGATRLSGIGTTLFTIYGSAGGELSTLLNISCPSSPDVLAGQTCTLSAPVAYPDDSTHTDGSVNVIVYKPDLGQTSIDLHNIGNNSWQEAYTFDSAGRYLFDVSAKPPDGMALLNGNDSQVIDVLQSLSPLNVIVEGLSGALPSPATLFTVTVSVDGHPAADARVSAEINPGHRHIELIGDGNGHYFGLFTAYASGEFTAQINANASAYKPGSASTGFAVSDTSISLLDAIENSRVMATHYLSLMKGEVRQIAEDGDWFTQAIQTVEMRTYLNAFIKILSLGLDLRNIGEAFSLANETDGVKPLVSQQAAIKQLDWLSKQPALSPDGMLFSTLAKNTDKHLLAEMLDQYFATGQVSPEISQEVFALTGRRLASKILAESIEDTAKETTPRILAEKVAGSNTALQNTIYPAFEQLVNDNTDLVNSYANTVTTLIPPLSDTLQTALTLDLEKRAETSQYLWKDVWWQGRTINSARKAKEVGDDVVIGWLKNLRDAGPTLALLAVPEPFSKVLSLAKGLYSLIDGWQKDLQAMNESIALRATAYATLSNADFSSRRLTDNEIGGLAQVRMGVYPQVPNGRIVSISDFSHGENQFLHYYEKQTGTSIVIENNGSYPALYSVNSYFTRKDEEVVFTEYLLTIQDFRTAMMLDPNTGNQVGWISLAPGQSKTMEVLFTDTDRNIEMRPNNGDEILYVLTAETESGRYVADTRTDMFLLTNATTYQSSVGESITQTLPYPITTQLSRNLYGTENTILIQVGNPFPYSISANVSQSIPLSLTVVTANDGTIISDTIQWQHTVPPHSKYEFAYIVRNDTPDKVGIQIPAARLSFYVPKDNANAEFASVPVIVSASDLPKVFLPLVVRNNTSLQ